MIELHKDDDPFVRLNIAKSTKSPDILDILSNDNHIPVLIAVSLNPHTIEKTLLSLCSSPIVNIRKNVIKHDNITDHILNRLSNDKNIDVRKTLVSNKRIPSRIINKMKDSEFNDNILNDLIMERLSTNLFEGMDNKSTNVIIEDFINFAADYLKLPSIPEIKLLTDLDTSYENKSFGGYSPEHKNIIISVKNRHILDCCRSLGHELVHYRQDLNNELNENSGKDGSPHENEANSEAGIIMRKFAKMNPHLFKELPIM